MSTRDDILQHLAEAPGSTATQLSQALHLGPADIRHHLAALLRSGRLRTLPGAAAGRGRPARRFELAGPGRTAELPLLCGILFDLLAGLPQTALPEGPLAAIARRLLGAAAENEKAVPRLNRLVHQLQALGYAPAWEARAQGPVIILGRCPYEAIRADRPALCDLDAILLGQQTGTTAQPLERLAAGGRRCLFRLIP